MSRPSFHQATPALSPQPRPPESHAHRGEREQKHAIAYFSEARIAHDNLGAFLLDHGFPKTENFLPFTISNGSADCYHFDIETESQVHLRRPMVTALQLPLDSLAEGEYACVVDVCGSCDCTHRLSEIGLRIGVNLRMVKQGNPCILAIGEQRLCFRPHDDCTVIVELN